MSIRLSYHPFAVEAVLEETVVLSFALPKEKLSPLVPEPLVLETWKDEWGFITLAFVKTSKLRPALFPSFLGNNFNLIGFRIFVDHVSLEQKRKRGLYIIRSYTDRKKMEVLGSIFTSYKYQTIDINFSKQENHCTIQSKEIGIDISYSKDAGTVPLPKGSPFNNWTEARRFAGPLPFTFSVFPERKELLIVQGNREDWHPQPIEVHHCSIDLLKSPPFEGAILANAFTIQNIPYRWEKGRVEKW